MRRFVFLWLFILLCVAQVQAQPGISVSPDNWQQAMNGDAGTVYRFDPGTYQNFTYAPKNGDVLECALPGQCILSGGRTLSTWQQDNAGRWYVTGQTQQGPRRIISGVQICASNAPRCNYPEILVYDGAPLQHVGTLDGLGTNRWYFDYDQDRIYLGNDPRGHLVQTSITPVAIGSSSANVTVRGFAVELYATATQNAAIEGYAGSERWTIERVTVRLNHAAGVVVRSRSVIRDSDLSWNGQSGFGASGDDVIVERNIANFNNFAGHDCGFDGGGAKMTRTNRLVLRGNTANDNTCVGLWLDIENRDSLVEGNTACRNTRIGIFWEISFRATIRGNTLCYNGVGGDNLAQGGIIITNGAGTAGNPLLIENNTVIVGTSGNAIGIRHDGSRADKRTEYITVRGNTVTFEARRGRVGFEAYLNGTVGPGISFENNTYYTLDGAYKHWWLHGSGALAFADWQQRGQDATGRVVIGMPATNVPIPPILTPTPTSTPSPSNTPSPTWTHTRTHTPTRTPEPGEPTGTPTPRRIVIDIDGRIIITLP